LTLLVVAVSALTVMAARFEPGDVAAAPTTTAAPTTSAGATTRSAGATTTRPAPTTTAVTTTTEAGPPPRNARRVASAVDIEKIRPTSMPFRMMGIATAVLIAGLAIAGFVFGKIRSRPPAPATPRTARADATPADATPSGPPAATMPPPTALPPPEPRPSPPGATTDWAPPTP
jgi:hypothetical protein